MPPTAEQRFRSSFDVLLAYALRKGVPFAEAQELVQATIVAALDRFDEGRGAYLAYCTTILKNRITNYWRDRKPNDPIENFDIPDPDTHGGMEREEEGARMKKMIERIYRELTPEESAFLKALGIAYEEMESRAVSQAARSLGLEPEKGWDVFRRIQRKAKALFPAMDVGSLAPEAPGPVSGSQPTVIEPSYSLRVDEESPRFSPGTGSPVSGKTKKWKVLEQRLMPAPRATILGLARWTASEESFLHVMESLTGEQMSRLRSIFT